MFAPFRSTSDHRKPSSSPRRTPVVTATKTGMYRFVPFVASSSVAISPFFPIEDFDFRLIRFRGLHLLGGVLDQHL
jgi:hypothetical protein